MHMVLELDTTQRPDLRNATVPFVVDELGKWRAVKSHAETQEKILKEWLYSRILTEDREDVREPSGEAEQYRYSVRIQRKATVKWEAVVTDMQKEFGITDEQIEHLLKRHRSSTHFPVLTLKTLE